MLMEMRRSRIVVALGLVAAAVLWLLVNKPLEGPTLIAFDDTHGLTVGDLPALAALVLAGLLIWRS